MLSLNIDRHCRIRNWLVSATFLRREGFSHWVSHRLVSRKNINLRFKDLERLCILFKCTPNDLLEWTPENEAEAKNEQHPLASLKKENNRVDDLRNLSFSQLKEISRIISEKK